MTSSQTMSVVLVAAVAGGVALLVLGGDAAERRQERKLDEFIANRRVSLAKRFPQRERPARRRPRETSYSW